MSQETGPSVMKVEELILTGQWVVDLSMEGFLGEWSFEVGLEG